MSDEKKVAEIIDRMSQLPPTQSETEQKLQLDALSQFDSSHWFKTISAPLLVICGEEDILCPPKDIKQQSQAMPNVKLVNIPEIGHMFPIERPLEFIQIAISFLAPFQD